MARGRKLRRIWAWVLTIIMGVSLVPNIGVIQANAGGYSARGEGDAPNRDSVYYRAGDSYYDTPEMAVGNCTWYAYGRSYENLGTEPLLCHGMAGDWYEYNYNNGNPIYPCGDTPQLGAVACWKTRGRTDGWGHVAVVEAIDGNWIRLSEGAYGYSYYRCAYMDSTNMVLPWGTNYDFQGYIYVLGGNTNREPKGCVDSVVSTSPGTVTVSGWAFDPDSPSTSIDVHVYVGPEAGQSGTENHIIKANLSGDDVNAAYGITGKHRFSATFDTNKTGTQNVHFYGIDTDHGNNPRFWTTSVSIQAKSNVSSSPANLGDEFDAMIEHVASSKYLGRNGSGTITANNLSSSGSFLWTFKRNTNGSYRIKNKESGQVIDDQNYGASNGSAVLCGTENGATAQNWFIYDVGGGKYVLEPECSPNKVIDIGLTSTDYGDTVRLWEYDTTNNNQKFAIVKDTTYPVIANVEVVGSIDGYTISLDATDNIGIQKVEFPSWKSYKGSTGCTWYKPTSQNGNHYTFKLSTNDFDGYQGKYSTHIYAWDYAGNSTCYKVNYTNPVQISPTSMKYNGHEYILVDSQMCWTDAKCFAEEFGGHLATITSQEEWNAIKGMLSEGGMKAYWLGASDDDSEGSFKWITNEAFAFNSFSSGQPDNAGGNENYLGIWLDNGKWVWNDFSNTIHESGTLSVGYIVEIEPVEVAVESVDLNNDGLTLFVGDSEKLIATVLPENATNQTVTWNSGNASIATVSSDGVVTAKAVGNTTITASAEGKSKTIYVTVKEKTVLVESIELEYGFEKEATVYQKYTETPDQLVISLDDAANAIINIKIKPSNASNKKISTKVDKSGLWVIDTTGIFDGTDDASLYLSGLSDTGDYVLTVYPADNIEAGKTVLVRLINEDGWYTDAQGNMLHYSLGEERRELDTGWKKIGKKYYFFDLNGYLVENAVDQNHTWDEGNVTKNATCTEDGTKVYTCTRCGVTKEETINALNHTPVKDEAVAPTCTETGLTEGSHCSVCGEVIKAQEVVKANGHTIVKDEAVAPTCTETGLTEGSHCSVCGDVIKNQEVVKEYGHRIVVDPEVEPTYTEAGLTEGCHCSVCGEIIIKQKIIPMLVKNGMICEDGNTYYYENGEKQVEWQQIEKKWYYFNTSGAMQAGWKRIGRKWYYFDTSGVMQTGWKKLGGKWYYFKTSGAMAANEYCRGYWLNKDGANTYAPKASWKKDKKGWYYIDTKGWYAKNTTLTIDGVKYSFDSRGYLK